MAIFRFDVAEGLAFGDGGFRQRRIAAALIGVAAQESGGVVENLVLQRFVHADRDAAHGKQRRSRAGMRARRHGGNVGGKQDEKSSRGAAGGRGPDVHDDRHRRGENVLDDFLHRGLQAAGRIHGDQNQGRFFARGLVDALGDVFGHDGLDVVGDVQLDDARGANGGRTLRRSGHATGEKQTYGQGYEQ